MAVESSKQHVEENTTLPNRAGPILLSHPVVPHTQLQWLQRMYFFLYLIRLRVTEPHSS